METKEPKSGTTPKRFQCPSCPKSFIKPFGLKEHVLINHVQDGESYPCDKCLGTNNLPKTFPTERTLKAHLRYAHGPRYKCQVCFKIITHYTNFRKHIQSHTTNIVKRFKCEFCSTTIGTRQHLQEHVFNVHKKKTPGVKYFKCELCALEFVSRFWLERHVVGKHVMDKEFQCTFCVNKFIDQPTLDKHIKYYHTKNKFLCDVCSKGFQWKKALRLHLEVEHSKLVYCDKCFTSFSDKSEFDQHLNPKPSSSSSSKLKSKFKCQTCSSCFDSQCNLTSHTHCHLEEIKLKKLTHDIKSVARSKIITNPPESKLKVTETQKLKKVFEFECNACKLPFKTLRWLLEHRRIYHSEDYQSQEQTLRNSEFSDDKVVFICTSNNCCFDTVSLNQVAIHYNEQHQLPKVNLLIMSPSRNGPSKMKNKSLSSLSSSPFSKNASKINKKKNAERFIQRRYKCGACSKLFKLTSGLKDHKRTHSKLT